MFGVNQLIRNNLSRPIGVVLLRPFHIFTPGVLRAYQPSVYSELF